MSDYIDFTNEHGHRIQMSREEYEKRIIPHNLNQYWEDRDKLRQFAMELVRDGFPAYASKAADRLLELYGRIEPALNFRAVVHMQAGELNQAKAVLAECIQQYPESGTAYTNIAKILAHEGEGEKAFEALQTGLLIDPNQDTALEMYVASFLQLERKDELIERLKQLGEREGAWRPNVVLGRLFLKDADLLHAMKAFQDAIKQSGESEEVIMIVTGELGQSGYVYQLIQIAEQYWKPDFEYPYTGFNFANALIATDQGEKAVAVLMAMHEGIDEPFKKTVEQFLSKIPQELLEKAEKAKESAKKDQTINEKKPWWKLW